MGFFYNPIFKISLIFFSLYHEHFFFDIEHLRTAFFPLWKKRGEDSCTHVSFARQVSGLRFTLWFFNQFQARREPGKNMVKLNASADKKKTISYFIDFRWKALGKGQCQDSCFALLYSESLLLCLEQKRIAFFLASLLVLIEHALNTFVRSYIFQFIHTDSVKRYMKNKF